MADDDNNAETQALFQIIRNEDQIGAVLHGQLWVETNLNKVLSYKTGRDWSKKIKGHQFEYGEKVRIAIAFGLIAENLFKPLQRLAELRNRLAHRFGYVLSEDEQADFLSLIPKVYFDNLGRFVTGYDKDREPEKQSVPSNVRYLSGLKGRSAVSSDFVLGIFVLVYELWNVLQDIEDQEFEELLDMHDEEE